MTQLEEELLQVVRRWAEDAENILRSVAGLSAQYDTGYAHGLHQAAKELDSFVWDRACRAADASAMAGMMYRDGG